MENNKNYAFVFARGGSKGLPRKNIKHLNGKPLIQYSIEIARRCPSIDKIFVSTDDEEISEIAKTLGTIVINRPVDLSSDTASEWLAWQHAINWVYQEYGEFHQFISLPTTSPLRSILDVESAIEQRIQQKADACISVSPSSRSPYFNMIQYNEPGLVSLVNNSRNDVIRRQDAPSVYDITTVVYVLTPEYILDKQGLFDGKVTAIEVPKERAVDIDDIMDFKFAELLLKEELGTGRVNDDR